MATSLFPAKFRTVCQSLFLPLRRTAKSYTQFEVCGQLWKRGAKCPYYLANSKGHRAHVGAAEPTVERNNEYLGLENQELWIMNYEQSIIIKN